MNAQKLTGSCASSRYISWIPHCIVCLKLKLFRKHCTLKNETDNESKRNITHIKGKALVDKGKFYGRAISQCLTNCTQQKQRQGDVRYWKNEHCYQVAFNQPLASTEYGINYPNDS